MVLKLYAFPNSACGQRVAAVLNEKEVSFELHVVEVAEIGEAIDEAREE